MVFSQSSGQTPRFRMQPIFRLSPHFRLSEFTKSRTAQKHGIQNVPSEPFELENLKALCREVLEPARVILNAPIRITSGYRTPALNRIIGGARHSQHMLGEAADFVVRGYVKGHRKERAMMDVAHALTMLGCLPFDQLIYEVRYRADKSGKGGLATNWTEWIHISHKRLGPNRREVLTIVKRDGLSKVQKGIHTPDELISEALGESVQDG